MVMFSPHRMLLEDLPQPQEVLRLQRRGCRCCAAAAAAGRSHLVVGGGQQVRVVLLIGGELVGNASNVVVGVHPEDGREGDDHISALHA